MLTVVGQIIDPETIVGSNSFEIIYRNLLKSEVLYDGPPRPSALAGERRPRRAIVPFPQLLTGCGMSHIRHAFFWKCSFVPYHRSRPAWHVARPIAMGHQFGHDADGYLSDGL